MIEWGATASVAGTGLSSDFLIRQDSGSARSHQRIDHFRAGLGVTEALQGEVIQECCHGFVVRRIGHAMDSDGQCLGRVVRLDIGI